MPRLTPERIAETKRKIELGVWSSTTSALIADLLSDLAEQTERAETAEARLAKLQREHDVLLGTYHGDVDGDGELA